MKIVGFNFKKIEVEKFSDSFENIKINTNIDISEIKKAKIDFFKGEEKIVHIKFSYVVNYEPKVARIEFKGVILLAVESKIQEQIIKEWENKKILEEIKLPLFNTIIRKSNIKALQLEDEMGLPLHIPLPSMKKAPEEK